MTWFYTAKWDRKAKPERCQRCHARAPTEEIRMLWHARDVASANDAENWWFCAGCAAELRRGAPSAS
jgi:hypothetical protein